MSKSIKVSDQVFETIQKYQGPRESYSSVIERALSVFVTITEVKETLGPSHYLMQRPKEVEVTK